MQQSTTEIIAQIIEEWLQERADHMRENLAKHGITPANSPLAQGIEPSGIVITGEGFSATIDLEDYYEFIDQGVQGIGNLKPNWKAAKSTGKFKFKTPFVSRAMVQNIRDWGARRGRQGVNKGNMNQVAFATALKVKRTGINQTLFFTDATKDVYENKLSQLLEERLGAKFEVSLL